MESAGSVATELEMSGKNGKKAIDEGRPMGVSSDDGRGDLHGVCSRSARALTMSLGLVCTTESIRDVRLRNGGVQGGIPLGIVKRIVSAQVMNIAWHTRTSGEVCDNLKDFEVETTGLAGGCEIVGKRKGGVEAGNVLGSDDHFELSAKLERRVVSDDMHGGSWGRGLGWRGVCVYAATSRGGLEVQTRGRAWWRRHCECVQVLRRMGSENTGEGWVGGQWQQNGADHCKQYSQLGSVGGSFLYGKGGTCHFPCRHRTRDLRTTRSRSRVMCRCGSTRCLSFRNGCQCYVLLSNEVEARRNM